MVDVFIGIGSNLGNREKNINKAIGQVKLTKGIKLDKISTIIESKPQEAPGPDYLNSVIKIQTNLKPAQLLKALQKIENNLKRKRIFKNCPRTLDLDILLYGKKKIKTEKLIIPHPKIRKRNFVKIPLSQIEPNWKDFLNDCHKEP